MPLTPTERKQVLSYRPTAVSPKRYVIVRAPKWCPAVDAVSGKPAAHKAGDVLTSPPNCGKCSVKIAGNPLQAAGFAAAVKQEQREWAEEQGRVSKRFDGTVNWKREGTDELDQDEVVAAYAADLTLRTKESIGADGKVTRSTEVVFSNRGDGDSQYTNDPQHRSELTGWTTVPRIYIEGSDGYGVEQIGTGRTVNTYYLNASHDACKYCKRTFYAEDFVQVPYSPEYNDQSVVVAIMCHYYECPMIRQFIRKDQRKFTGFDGSDTLPVEDTTLAGDAYTSSTYIIPGSVKTTWDVYNHVMHFKPYTVV